MDTTEFSLRMQAYQKSVQEEYSRETGSEEAAVKLAKDTLFKSLPDAIDELVSISKNAKNDGVRLGACKYIIDACTSEKGLARNSDPFAAMFAELNKMVPQPDAIESELSTTVGN